MAVTTVIFDMGGVLVWTHWERATVPLGRLAGITSEKVMGTIRTGDAYLPFMRGEIDTAEFAGRMAASLGMQMPVEEFIALWNSILAPNPDAGGILERLKEEIRLALGSNTDPEHYKRSVEVQPALALFDDVLLSYELGVCKPDAAFFSLALEGLGVGAEECVFIDDLSENVASAMALGIEGIHFKSMEQVEEELTRMGILQGKTGV